MNTKDDDKDLGIYNKFKVTRVDGSSRAGKKHHRCRYFVLDLDHDPQAIPAIRAYSLGATAAGYGKLGDELWKLSQELTTKLENRQKEAK